MSANDDLRLAWIAHHQGRPARRDALLTLAVAAAGRGDGAWVERVRAFLAAARPGHLYARPGPLDEALSDPRVVAAILRLRQSYPPARVNRLVQGEAVTRGPYPGRTAPVATLVDELLARPRKPRRRDVVRLDAVAAHPLPVGALAPLGPVTPEAAGLPETSGPILTFYLTVLLGVAALCASVLNDQRDGRRAA